MVVLSDRGLHKQCHLLMIICMHLIILGMLFLEARSLKGGSYRWTEQVKSIIYVLILHIIWIIKV